MKKVGSKGSFLKSLLLAMMFLCCSHFSYSQPVLPQRTISVTAAQAINFGAIYVSGSGGSVTVDWQGSRTSNGGIICLPLPIPQPAIFEIKLCPGRNVVITFDATAILTGSYTGQSLILDIGPTERGPNGIYFQSNNDCNFITPLRVGGTLHIPGNAMPDLYLGWFAVTFNQE
jgi:hypothetical protein